MHAYKLMDDNITMLVNSTFFDEEDLAYVNKHRFNVMFTEVRSSIFVKRILNFQKCGYKFELRTEPDFAPDGLRLEDKIYAYFTHPDNIEKSENTELTLEERNIITDVLNYLICLSRLVSPVDANRAFGFKFDGAYIDLFRKIKNSFKDNELNVDSIKQNYTFKQMFEELDNLEEK